MQYIRTWNHNFSKTNITHSDRCFGLLKITQGATWDSFEAPRIHCPLTWGFNIKPNHPWDWRIWDVKLLGTLLMCEVWPKKNFNANIPGGKNANKETLLRIFTHTHIYILIQIILNQCLIWLKKTNTLPSADVFSGKSWFCFWLMHAIQNHFAAQVALPSLPFRMPEKCSGPVRFKLTTADCEAKMVSQHWGALVVLLFNPKAINQDTSEAAHKKFKRKETFTLVQFHIVCIPLPLQGPCWEEYVV